jgi:hypothetical protein
LAQHSHAASATAPIGTFTASAFSAPAHFAARFTPHLSGEGHFVLADAAAVICIAAFEYARPPLGPPLGPPRAPSWAPPP